MARKMIGKTDLLFFFGGCRGSADCLDYEEQTCSICGKDYFNHGITVILDGRKFPGKLGFFFYLCGECMLSAPKELARKIREYEPIVRKKRPTRKGGEDEDHYTKWADDMLKLADGFDRIESLDAIMDGVMARHIGEAYLELNAPKRAKGKEA